MLLAKLSLSNFRNYSDVSFSFSDTFTLIVGPNTAGKTSLLEAVMLGATGRSFRARRERDMIAEGKEVARVSLSILPDSHEKDKSDELEVVVTTGTVLGKKSPYKKYRINGVGKRGVDAVGMLPAVLFWPEDLNLITGSPSRRRNYLDTVLSQTDRSYRRALATYEKALRIRNKLLHTAREGAPIRPEEMEYWSETLLKTGALIHTSRKCFLAFVNTVHIDPPGEEENHHTTQAFTVHYDHSTITPERLEKYRHAEQAAGVTLIGPHRDDFYVVKDRDRRELHNFGSRGEQRLGVLWLKIAEVQYITEQKGEKPLLLLDDIFSELDRKHRLLALRLVENQQTIMTATEKTAQEGPSVGTVIEMTL